MREFVKYAFRNLWLFASMVFLTWLVIGGSLCHIGAIVGEFINEVLFFVPDVLKVPVCIAIILIFWFSLIFEVECRERENKIKSKEA